MKTTAAAAATADKAAAGSASKEGPPPASRRRCWSSRSIRVRASSSSTGLRTPRSAISSREPGGGREPLFHPAVPAEPLPLCPPRLRARPANSRGGSWGSRPAIAARIASGLRMSQQPPPLPLLMPMPSSSPTPRPRPSRPCCAVAPWTPASSLTSPWPSLLCRSHCPAASALASSQASQHSCLSIAHTPESRPASTSAARKEPALMSPLAPASWLHSLNTASTALSWMLWTTRMGLEPGSPSRSTSFSPLTRRTRSAKLHISVAPEPALAPGPVSPRQRVHAPRKAERNARGSLDDGIPESNVEEARAEETSASCQREASGSRGCTACSTTSVHEDKLGASVSPPLRSCHRLAPGDTVMRLASATASSTASRVASLVPSPALPPPPLPPIMPRPRLCSVPLGASAGSAVSLASASESRTSVRSSMSLTLVRCVPSSASSNAKHSPVGVCVKIRCVCVKNVQCGVPIAIKISTITHPLVDTAGFYPPSPPKTCQNPT